VQDPVRCAEIILICSSTVFTHTLFPSIVMGMREKENQIPYIAKEKVEERK
jgi:hypothetical protein